MFILLSNDEIVSTCLRWRLASCLFTDSLLFDQKASTRHMVIQNQSEPTVFDFEGVHLYVLRFEKMRQSSSCESCMFV